MKNYSKTFLASALILTVSFFSFGGEVFAAGQVPSVPGGVMVSSSSESQNNVSWSASSDPDNTPSELIYIVYRNGQALASTGQGVLTYSDTAITPQTSYYYNVASQDPDFNTSAWSDTANLFTGPGSTTTPDTTGSSTPNSTSTSTPDTTSTTTPVTTGTSTPIGTSTPTNTNTTTPATTTPTTSTTTPHTPIWNFSGDIGFMVIPMSLFNRLNSTSTSTTTNSNSPYTFDQYGYPMMNGNYVDCNGNIDNDPGHHTKDIYDTDPAHNVGKNCPGGMPMAPMGNNSSMNPNSWNNNWQTMSFWSAMNGNMEQWVILPINSSTLEKLHHVLQ